jgi:uncharacterized protein (TIGR02270 family)
MHPSRQILPIGFAPAEISALVNHAVIGQHAGDAAFLWTQRTRAVGEPHYALRDLANLDERVEAHLDGLRFAEGAGWEACRENVASEGPGEAFALGVLAFGGGDRSRVEAALTMELPPERARRSLASALGWIEPAQAAPWLRELVGSPLPARRALGIAGFAVQRQDPGPALAAAVEDVDAAVRARTFRAAGELKRRDLRPALRAHLADRDGTAKLWAAWSLVLMGDPSGMPHLLRAVRERSPFAERALRLALPALAAAERKLLLADLAALPASQPLSVIGMGAGGDPGAVPLLLDLMSKPKLARLAGEAFSMITGADLSYLDLDQEPPPGGDEAEEEALALGYESNLPWPSPPRVARWWSENGKRFTPGTRHLRGARIDRASCLATLAQGTQRQRAAAALELALIDPAAPFFEVRARGSRQEQQLQQLARGLA